MHVQPQSWQNIALSLVPYELAGNDTPWVLATRKAAFQRFEERGFPTRREEEWKYTDVSMISKRGTLAPDNIPPEASSEAKLLAWSLSSEHMHLMVFVNGHFDSGLSTLDDLPAGVQLSSLADMLDDGASLPKALFKQQHEHTVFSALNNAFVTDGAVLNIAPDTILDKPIYILLIASGHGTAIYPRIIVMAGSNSQATIIEHYMGTLDAHNFTNATTQINLEACASIEHCKLTQEGPAAAHIAGIHAQLANGSHFTSKSFVFGGRLVRNDITASLNEPNCSCSLDGLYLLNDKQHVDHHTRIDHIAASCTSREYYRGVLDGESRGVFNGKVVVHAGANHTDANQTNHNLLLSRQAEIDTKPQLEIFADDVKCTHGATVGQLSDDSLFYLRSRGLDEEVARSMLIYGFANDIIRSVDVPYLRTRLEHLLLDRLPQGEMVKDLL
nr:Fe-S cluster assembly protein SufD [uncultured Methylotenera sp.]